MALTTKKSDSQTPQDKDPGQDEFDKIIDKNFSPGDERMMEERAANAAELGVAESEKQPDNQAQLQEGLIGQENQVGSGYKGDKKAKARFELSRRKKIATGGGIIALIVSLFTFFILQGPLEFFHIAQLLQQFHFTHQDNASDGRMGKLTRWARTGDVGQTRLTSLESKYHNRIVNKLTEIGLEPVYGPNKYLESFTIDTANEKSPYHGMSNEEVKATLNERFGAKVNLTQIGGFNGTSGKFSVKATGFFGAQRTNYLLAKEMHVSRTVGALRKRIIGKYGYASWHPMKILDRKLNQSLATLYDNWRTAREQRLKTGVSEAVVDGTSAGQKNADGTTDPLSGEKTNLSSDKVRSTLKAIQDSKSFKVAGGVAAAVGIVCVAKTVNDNIGDVRYYQVIVPLMRMGMDAITVGNQIMSGQDVDAREVSFLAKNFDTVDKNGKVTSSWNNAKSIRAEEGQTGGKDIDKGTKDLIAQGSPSWLSWTDSSVVGGLCSGVGQAVTGVVSFAVGILSGETINTAASAVAGFIAGPYVIDGLTNLLSGKAVDVLATGADWGNDINYGARLAANSTALSTGGVALTNSQVAELDKIQYMEDENNYKSKSIADRLINPYDTQSVISKFIDNSGSSFTTSIAKMRSVFSFGNFFSAIPHLFSTPVHAAPIPYDYGFPEYGFSQADLENPKVDNPYKNADTVATILDSSRGPGYIKKVADCFGVTINKGDEGWDAIPADAPVNPYDGSKYKPNDCIDSSDKDWLQIRFFILDTGVMEGYACYQGDDQSCSNIGLQTITSSGNAASNQSTTTQTSGSTIDLSLLATNSDNIPCASGTKDLGVVQTKFTLTAIVPSGIAPKIRLCQIPDIPGQGNNISGVEISGGAVVASAVSGGWAALARDAKAAGIPLYSNSSFRLADSCGGTGDGSACARPGKSPHQSGAAIDFGNGLYGIKGTSTTSCSGRARLPNNKTWAWLHDNAEKYGIYQYTFEAWHWDPFNILGNRCDSSS